MTPSRHLPDELREPRQPDSGFREVVATAVMCLIVVTVIFAIPIDSSPAQAQPDFEAVPFDWELRTATQSDLGPEKEPKYIRIEWDNGRILVLKLAPIVGCRFVPAEAAQELGLPGQYIEILAGGQTHRIDCVDDAQGRAFVKELVRHPHPETEDGKDTDRKE